MEEIIHPKGKIYYSMGEVCEIFGVNASLLRFWEEEFPVLKIAKNSRGHRIYSKADVDNLRLIYHLVKEQGMTLDGARKRMRQGGDGIKREAEIVERLRSVRNMLAALKAEMDEGVEVIDFDDEIEEPIREVALSPKEEEVVEEPAAEVVSKEKLADFEMKMPTTEPVVEEPKKPSRGQKMGTLIGGDLFSPEDIRLAVAKEKAKKSSQEAKKQVVEQTLF
jgi:DNA-binding transcriptional MerR regulator